MNDKAGKGDSARTALRISQHTPAAPNLFTGPGVAVNAWQTPKSQRCRKPRCVVEHVIHLFTCTCWSFVSFVSLVFFLYIYIIEAWRGLVWFGRAGEGFLLRRHQRGLIRSDHADFQATLNTFLFFCICCLFSFLFKVEAPSVIWRFDTNSTCPQTNCLFFLPSWVPPQHGWGLRGGTTVVGHVQPFCSFREWANLLPGFKTGRFDSHEWVTSAPLPWACLEPLAVGTKKVVKPQEEPAGFHHVMEAALLHGSRVFNL